MYFFGSAAQLGLRAWGGVIYLALGIGQKGLRNFSGCLVGFAVQPASQITAFLPGTELFCLKSRNL